MTVTRFSFDCWVELVVVLPVLSVESCLGSHDGAVDAGVCGVDGWLAVSGFLLDGDVGEEGLVNESFGGVVGEGVEACAVGRQGEVGLEA